MKIRTCLFAALILSICSAARAIELYNGALGTTPDQQGWIKFNTDGASAPVTGGGKTSFDTTASQAERGGFSNYNLIFPVNPAFPSLNRTNGYSVVLDMKVLNEAHASNDRSGVGLIVLSSDLFGVELEFWQNEIWIQSGADFQHAEGVAFNTTAASQYQLLILNNTYQLFANSSPSPILTGNLRNYSTGGNPVYSIPNFMFLGDDTTSASGGFEFSRLAIAVPEPAALGGVAILIIATRRRR